RNNALLLAFDDPDEGIERLALTNAPEGCPPSLGERLDKMATDQFRPPEVRALALRAVGPLKRANSLPILLNAARVPGGFLRRPKLKEKGPELLAALNVLTQFWATDEEAGVVLGLAAHSEDSAIRAAAKRKGTRA
ncbi:MAG TPA: hypothetical protein VL295_06175, partial [Gemmatimonadales bacterium]|nr:hypothetical protein [Gemmatimonadales bacterium]